MKELLNIVLLLRLQPNLTATNASSAYSPEIIQYLLGKQVICSAMIESPGGLLGVLRARNDWVNLIIIFFENLSPCMLNVYFSELNRAGVRRRS